MRLYAVYFGVNHEGEGLEGVFSSQELALEQVELSKVMHGGHRLKGGAKWLWDDRFGHDHAWSLNDLYIRLEEIELDRKVHERISD